MKYKDTLIRVFTILVLIAALCTPLLVKGYADPGDAADPPTVDIEEAVDGEIPQDIEESSNLEDEEAEAIVFTRIRVIDAIEIREESVEYSGGGLSIPTQIVDVIVLEGAHKGKRERAQYVLSSGFNDNYRFTPLKKGDEALAYINESTDQSIEAVEIVEVARDKHMYFLTAAFILLLIIVGGFKGFKAVISLVLTAVAIFKFLLPAILKGWDPVLVSVVICTIIIIFTMLLISGWNKKTLSAILGTVSGVLIAGAIAIVVGNMAKLTGIGGDEAQMLMYIPREVIFDFRGLLFAGIIIGTMGANMDVGMSIASSMHEIKLNTPQISSKDLIKAGMNIGRDIMGTMSNTLILAYTGGTLHLLLLLMAYKNSITEVISWDIISSEILRAMAGSIGLVITIPITALISGFIEREKEKEDE